MSPPQQQNGGGTSAASPVADDGRDAAGTPSSDAGTERSTPDDLRTSRRKSTLIIIHLTLSIDWLMRTRSMFIVRRQSRTFSYGEWTTALIGGACGGGARHWSLGRRLDPPPVPHLNQWRRHCNQQRHSSNLTCVWELARFGFEYCFNIQSICNMESIEYEIWNWLVLFWIRVVEFYMHPHPVSWWELKGFLGFLGNFWYFWRGRNCGFFCL